MVIKIRDWESNLEQNRQKSLFDVEAVENELDMLFSSFIVEVVTGEDDLNNIIGRYWIRDRYSRHSYNFC